MTGSGTEGDPYIIYNVTDLQAMETNLSAYYELANDINASITSTWNGGDGFDPVGQLGSAFTGFLDGAEYIITGLFIDRGTTNYCGLFGVTNNATIFDITLASCDITGDQSTGALVGRIEGTTSISNCSSSGSIIGTTASTAGLIGGLIGWIAAGTVMDSSSSCTVVYDSGWLGLTSGGFCGHNSGAIISCYATGSVSAANQAAETRGAGGFLGTNAGTVSKSYATGTVTAPDSGGFASINSGTILDCYTRSATDARNTAAGYGDAGGFIRINNSTITDCYATGQVQGDETKKGFCVTNNDTINTSFWDTQTTEQDNSNGGTGKTTSQMKTKSTFTGAGWDFVSPIWGIAASINNGYPYFGSTLSEQDSVDQTIIGNKVSLEAIRNIEIVYGGRFYIDKSGNAVYESRYHRNV